MAIFIPEFAPFNFIISHLHWSFLRFLAATCERALRRHACLLKS